jgi:hypothetical protein
MRFDLLEALELNLLGFVDCVEYSLLAGLLLPVCNSLFGTHDFKFFLLELPKAHATTEALLVQLSNRHLIRVVIRGSEQHAIGTASRHTRIVAFGRLNFPHFFAVKLVSA